jgi:Amt family ammonium transporter
MAAILRSKFVVLTMAAWAATSEHPPVQEVAENHPHAELAADSDALAKQVEILLGEQAKLMERLAGLENEQGRRLTATVVATQLLDHQTCLNTIWLLLCGAMVMFMHAGFAVLEAGSVRQKNATMVLLKNFATVCIGTVTWYFWGYATAYGVQDDPSVFWGSKYFAGAELVPFAEGAMVDQTGTVPTQDWFFQWAFCATSATIVSGGVAERIQLPIYFLFCTIMTGLIYPTVVYWTWTSEGFLSKEGYSDFAGSGIVHLTGGIAALVGAVVCGPRDRRFTEPDKFNPHNMGLVALGTFILWFGFYGFNCGSTLTMSSAADATSASLVAMNSTIAGSAGALTVFLLRAIVALAMKKEQIYDLAGMCNGVLAGLVAICAGVGSMEPGFAFLVGIVGGLFHEIGHWTLLILKVDDPLDAFAVHGMGGIAGILLRPLVGMAGADGNMFKWHFIGMLAIIAWSGGISIAVLLPFRLIGKLSYGKEAQLTGADVHCSPPKCYTIETNEGTEGSPTNAVTQGI